MKILLNSLYGALLNKGLRFYDERMGQSVTLTGRSITRHMISKTNEVVTGVYDLTGKAIVYGDTDSCYFSAYGALKDDPAYAGFEWSKENVVELYDAIAEEVNASFASFMHRTFNTSLERGALIKAGRELVASRGLFIKKKKYALLMYEFEGKRLDVGNKPGKLKAMGLDLKRADTPKYMQKFLENLLMNVLLGEEKTKMFNDIIAFRDDFKTKPGWEKGSPKAVKAMSVFSDEVERQAKALASMEAVKKGKKAKVDMPGHVRASINWNRLCDIHGDKYSMRISDGSKVIVCSLKKNIFNMDKIAYPIDEPHLPDWFKKLPFDHDVMEETIIDKKLLNLVGVLDWNLTETKTYDSDDFFVIRK